jgi:hypothetical protein
MMLDKRGRASSAELNKKPPEGGLELAKVAASMAKANAIQLI